MTNLSFAIVVLLIAGATLAISSLFMSMFNFILHPETLYRRQLPGTLAFSALVPGLLAAGLQILKNQLYG